MISIIIPVKNGEKTIQDTINSCLSQRESNIEILIVDDGSTDNTGQICSLLARTFKQIRYFKVDFKHDNNCRNYGARKAKGDKLVFIDSDARFTSSKELSKLLKGLEIAEVAGTGVKESKNTNFWQKLDYYCSWYKATPKRRPRFVDFSPFMCFAAKKEIVLKHPFREIEGLYSGSDIAWGHVIRENGYYWYITKATVYHVDRNNLKDILKRAYTWGKGATFNRNNKYDRFRYFFPKNKFLSYLLIPFGAIGHTMWIHYQWAQSREFRNLLFTPLILLRNLAFHIGVAKGI